MTRDEALQKIKKCLALAASSEQHEAAAALRQAQKLMEAFGLSEVDVSLADVSECRQKAPSAPLVRWEASLAHAVSDAFGCTIFTSTERALTSGGTWRTQRQFVFIGVGMASEVAGYAFDVLARQCAKDRRVHIGRQSKNCKPKTKVARGDAYAEGWVSGVRGKLERFAGQAGNPELIEQYMQQRHPAMQTSKFKDRTKGKNVAENDYHHGFQSGRKAELNHGLGARAPQALIGGNNA
ncbi:MAG: DUF2786 domain-containing protein [Comamonas sp.]